MLRPEPLQSRFAPPERTSSALARRVARCAIACGALVALGACGEQKAALTPNAERPRHGGTFRMAQDPPDRLDPACVDDAYEASLVNQIFDGLVAFDAHLNTVPSIATSWIVSADGTVYTFQIKRGLRFHDGAEVTAEDIVYSLARPFRIPEGESGLARQYLCHIAGTREYAEGKAKSVRGLEALSTHVVRVTLQQPFAPFLAVLASEMARIVPKHLVERIGDEEFARRPVGSGPFRFASWEPERRIVLLPNHAAGAPQAHLDSLVFELHPGNVREYAPRRFFAGGLSAVAVPDGRLAEFQQHQHSRVVSRQELSSTFIALNPQLSPFEDVRVRRAFAMAIDRLAILKMDPGSRVPPYGILPPGMPGYAPESKLLPFDPAAAAALLAAAGFPGGRGLAPVQLTHAMTSQEGTAVFDLVRSQLAAVGFEVQVQALPWRVFSDRLGSGALQSLSVTWTADIPDPDSFLYPMCATGGSANFIGYSHPDVDALLLRGRATRNTLERLAVYRDAERLALQDAVIIPLYHPLSAVAIQDNVRGFSLSAMGWASVAFEDIWLDDAPAAPAAPALLGRTP